MLRIPKEQYELNKYDDFDVINAWKWFMSFMTKEDWQKRKIDIEKKVALEFRSTKPFSEPLTEGTLMVVKDDSIGWYLYLIDMLINEPHKYEYYQGARVVPIFKRLGSDLGLLKSITGIENKIKTLLRKRRSEADALLFEILTALLWARNGHRVTFITERHAEKTPDIMAEKNGKIWNIECKRQSKTPEYTYRETAKRQKMISYVSKALLQRNIILDIVFHVELESLPDTFLKDLLEHKLELAIAGKIVSNEQVDIDLEFVDIGAIKEHLIKNSVKHGSPMLRALIAKKPMMNKGFTSGLYANFFRVGDGQINNLYISDIAAAYGVLWSCDAAESLWAKARDIKNQVYSAMQQFDSQNTAVIHIGIETFDGPEVEKKRLEKIRKTIKQINPQNSNLRWVFCNFFHGYSLPEECWVFDETVSTMSAYVIPKSPIDIKLMIVPDNAEAIDNLSHWERDLP